MDIKFWRGVGIKSPLIDEIKDQTHARTLLAGCSWWTRPRRQASLASQASPMSSRRSMKGEARGALAGKSGDTTAAIVPGAGGKNPFQCVLDKENKPDGKFAGSRTASKPAAKAAPCCSWIHDVFCARSALSREHASHDSALGKGKRPPLCAAVPHDALQHGICRTGSAPVTSLLGH